MNSDLSNFFSAFEAYEREHGQKKTSRLFRLSFLVLILYAVILFAPFFLF